MKKEIALTLKKYPLFNENKKPNVTRDEIIKFSNDIRSIIMPGFFKSDKTYNEIIAYTFTIFEKAFNYAGIEADINDAVDKFFLSLPEIIRLLALDVEAFWDGDPACNSKEEIVIAYPGFYAIYIHRIAHELYKLNIPYLPRILSELAHSSTGIDINPGATIGESFFIDHGTGIVIGETTIIGNHVKIYQGVTLGALSVKDGHKLNGVKRHPTIKNNVTIYSGASILGGDVVIEDNCIIGGNTFITDSIEANSLVKTKKCGVEIRKLND